MALTQEHRRNIHRGLAPIVGEEEADAMLAHFPTRPGDEPVTVEHLDARLAELRTELKADTAQLRNELREELGGLRNELKEDMGMLRNELKAELNEGLTQVRIELREVAIRTILLLVTTMAAVAAIATSIVLSAD